MRLTCRVLPYETADGPANMALDEALLDAVAADAETAYLRTYGWTVPTLSLGYFQRLAEVQADARWQSVAVVRRLTGGGAIWHHQEVTYALIVPCRTSSRASQSRTLSGRARGDRGDTGGCGHQGPIGGVMPPSVRRPVASGRSSASRTEIRRTLSTRDSKS